MAPKKVIILGGNDTSYQLQQGLLARQGSFDVSLVHDSNYIYTPSALYPELLAGLLSVRDAAIENNKYFSTHVKYLRQPPITESNAVIVNTVTDAHNISILHLPAGRRRYFTLHNTDNVIMAGAEIAQFQALVVSGATNRAAAYACAAAQAGFKTWLVAEPHQLINTHFDDTAKQLISNHLANSNVQLTTPNQALSLTEKYPVLYTPNGVQTPGLMRTRQQLNHNYDHYPVADFTLQSGGDWYQLPLQATEQLINRIQQSEQPHTSSLSYWWGNKPELPHRVDINRFALHYAGELHSKEPQNCLTLSIPEQNIYRKIILTDNRIAGFVLAGDVRGSERLADMMLTHQDIRPHKDNLVFIGC